MSRLAAEENILRKTNIIQGFAIPARLGNGEQQEYTPFCSTELVDSSFTAWLLGATRVNPLPPHYKCPVCEVIGPKSFRDEIQGMAMKMYEKYCR